MRQHHLQFRWRRFAVLVIAVAGITLACSNATPSGEENLLKTMVASTLTALPSATAIPPTQTAPPPSATPLPPTATSPPATAVSGQKVYDFTDRLCDASWANTLEPIPCPSKDQATLGVGWVHLVEKPVLEGVYSYERGMLTHPATNTSLGQSQIFGTYPPFTVQPGDQFRATVGCLSSWETLYGWPATGCKVQFALEYYDAAGTYHSYQQMTPWTAWEETYDGAITTVNVDLSPLAGQTVRFTLVVRDQGNPKGDYALWVEPHIWRLAQP